MDVQSSGANTSGTFWQRVFDAQNEGEGSKRTDYPVKHEFVAWDYTRHHDGSSSAVLAADASQDLSSGAVRVRQQPLFGKGLSTTRFHKGFQRRRQAHIKQDEARLRRDALKQRASVMHLDRRRDRLAWFDKRNGFDVITGKFDAANRRCTTPFHAQPRTRNNGALSAVAERAEYILLRDSDYKFHAPAWSGDNHDRRQDLLQREGLIKPKKSTLLGVGTSDLASVGAEDMFSKSVYDPARACAIEGLVETARPGRFTPRKTAARAAPGTAAGRGTKMKDGSPFDSPAVTGTVFRIIPAGLNGKDGALKGTTGVGVAGIAPPKRLGGCRIGPELREGLATEKGEGPACANKLMRRQHGETRVGSVSTGQTHSSKSTNEPSSLAKDFAPVASPTTALNAWGGNAKGDEWPSGRRLSRSISEHMKKPSSSGSARGTSTAGEGSLRSSASTGRLPAHDSAGRARMAAAPGWTPGSSWRSASPARRRDEHQLALDLAAVRSLGS